MTIHLSWKAYSSSAFCFFFPLARSGVVMADALGPHDLHFGLYLVAVFLLDALEIFVFSTALLSLLGALMRRLN